MKTNVANGWKEIKDVSAHEEATYLVGDDHRRVILKVVSGLIKGTGKRGLLIKEQEDGLIT